MTSPPDPRLSVDRARTRNGILAGTAAFVVLYAIGYATVPPLADAATFDDRLRLALWLCAGPAVFVYAAFFACLRLRDTSPETVNPLLRGESVSWQINQRVLTNSVEQAVIFVPLVLALAARVDEAHARLLPLHVALWLIARVAFWVGYRIHPAWRAPGMTATHMMSLATLVWLVRFSVAS